MHRLFIYTLIVLGICTYVFYLTFENFSFIVAQNVTNRPILEEQTNNTKIDIPFINASDKFILYENPDYNFKIKYPVYLEESESNLLPNQVVKFTLPGDGILLKPDLQVTVFVYPGHDANISMSDYKEIYESFLYDFQEKGEMRFISSNISKVVGNDVLNVVYYDYRNYKSMKDNEITIFKNGEKFLILYSTQPALFNTYLSDFRQMVESFEITSVNNITTDTTMSRAIDEYANYFASVTEGSVNLTRAFQYKVGLWQSGEISNSTMAELTNQYLKKFILQLKNFNEMVSPNIFNDTKQSMANSFANEIKSYEFFRDYLLSGNATKNDISTDYLSQSLEDEARAFKEYEKIINSIS
jgi:hypothetical protein